MVHCFSELADGKAIPESLESYEKRHSTLEQVCDILVEEGLILYGYTLEKHTKRVRKKYYPS
jgi:hypothetical protein